MPIEQLCLLFGEIKDNQGDKAEGICSYDGSGVNKNAGCTDYITCMKYKNFCEEILLEGKAN